MPLYLSTLACIKSKLSAAVLACTCTSLILSCLATNVEHRVHNADYFWVCMLSACSLRLLGRLCHC